MSQLHNLKQFIIDEYIPDSHNAEISNDLNLIENGILDSLAVLKLVAYIEDQFNIALEPDEIDPEYLNSINALDTLIQAKLAG